MSNNKTFTGNRISRKAFAAIMTAKDDMKEIIALGEELKVTNAYKTAQKMAEIAAKYMADFENVDPAWTPATAKKEEAAAPAEATVTE